MINEEDIMEDIIRKKKKKRRSSGLALLIVLIAVALILVVLLIMLMSNKGDTSSIFKKKTISLKNSVYEIEAGNNMNNVPITDLIQGNEEMIKEAVFSSTAVNFNVPGQYNATVTSGETVLSLTIQVKDTTAPEVTIKTDSVITAKAQLIRPEAFISEAKDVSPVTIGFVDNPTDNPATVGLKETLIYEEAGEYSVGVVALDDYGNYTLTPVKINVTAIDYSKILNQGAEVSVDINTDFSQFPSEKIPFGFGASVDENNRPDGCNYYKTKYGQYAADFIQPNSEHVFLTMDEGYEYGYTGQILDTLKEKNVKAVFFVTLPYVKDNPELVQRMIDEGHVLGNHSSTHPAGGLQQYSAEKQIEDINAVTQYVKEHFNYDMYLFRFPEGSFSEQSLAIVQALGYRSVFWSFAYKDWVVDAQPPVAESLQNALDKAHGGAIYLLHAESQTNTEMLGDFIDGIRAKGYTFGYYEKMD